jgi:sulfite oxidase
MPEAPRGKDPSFIVRSRDPLCGGPPLHRLVERPLTWREDFFVRDHGTVPAIDPMGFRLSVEGLVGRPARLSIGELVARYPRRQAVVTLQCAGNRRDELIAVRPIPGEVAWGAEAVGTARWSGVSLADVLGDAGVAEGAAHVAFEGLDAVTRHGRTFGFGASISLGRALAGDVLLVDRMNGAPLPPEHGFPLRVVVPGYIGARSVKWLGRIVVQARPSDNYFEARAYKELPAEADPAAVDWASFPPIEDAQLHAVVCLPEDETTLAAGDQVVMGYATTGGHRRVVAVEVSSDGARSWSPAELLDRPSPGAWVRWRAPVTLGSGEHELVARATDSDGRTQVPDVAARWNPKGYLNDAWHRVTVRVR